MSHEYEHDEYETRAAAERAPEYDAAREHEPANDNAPDIESDTIDARLGGEKDEWPTEDRGESGYVFDGRDVIGPDGASWLAAWGENAENVALYDEMVSAFFLGETTFQLPDYSERIDGGEILYKTFMLLNEDGSVGYEIYKHELFYANDNEPLPFDNKDEEDADSGYIAMNDNAPEPLASDISEATEDDACTEEAAVAFTVYDAAPVAEYAPVVEQTMAEMAVQEHRAYAQEPLAQATESIVRETPPHIAAMLTTVTYHAETYTPTEEVLAPVIEAAARTGEQEPVIVAEAQHGAPRATIVEQHDTRDILDIIPNLPTFASAMETMPVPAPEARAEAEPETTPRETIVRAETTAVAAVVVHRSREVYAAEPVRGRTPQNTAPVPTQRIVTPRHEPTVRTEPRSIKTEAPRAVTERLPRAVAKPAERPRSGGYREERRRFAAPRPAPERSRHAERAETPAQSARSREIVHPARLAAQSRRFQAHAANDTPAVAAGAPVATLNGITLRRAA